MRLPWLISGGAVLALVAFWLWPDASGRAASVTSLADDPENARPGIELAAPPPAADSSEGRASVRVTPAEESESRASAPQAAAALRLVRVRFLDADSRQPLAGRAIDLALRFARGTPHVPGVTDAAGEFEVRVRPGEYLALQPVITGDADGVPREITPHVFEVPAGDFDEPHVVTLLGRRPPHVLEIEVVDRDGAPAGGAWVLFNCTTEELGLVEPRGRTAADGRAWIGVRDPAGFTDGLLWAWDDEGNTSAYLPVEAPFVPGVRRLVLAPGARVEVVVRDGERRPIVGRRVLLASTHPAGHRVHDETDAAGRWTFTAVAPGEYTVGVRQGRSSPYTSDVIDVRQGETRTVEVELLDGEQFAAVRGRIIDEHGGPVSDATLIVTPEGSWAQDVRSDRDGAFAFHGDECESLLVQANLWPEGDVYEPESIRVAHGTHDLLFQRVGQAQSRSFEVEVYDLVTGEEVEHFAATIDRGPGTEEWSNSYAPRRAFDLRVLPSTRWRIASHGYVVRELELKQALDRLADGERLRVGLEPGLDHSFVVRDASTLEPLEDVLFRSESNAEVRSDARGFVRIQAADWSVYQVSRSGYETSEWDPDDFVLWAWGPVLLERSADRPR